jgi:hypothetical protein
VTGDAGLCNEAVARLGKVYGLLWMLDRMAESKIVSSAQLYDRLSRIAAHPRCRLPHADVQVRLSADFSGKLLHHARSAALAQRPGANPKALLNWRVMWL